MSDALGRLPWRNRLEPAEFARVESILREASRADLETMTRIAAELRTEPGLPRQQAEIDGVIARYRAAHPETVRAHDGPQGQAARPVLDIAVEDNKR